MTTGRPEDDVARDHRDDPQAAPPAPEFGAPDNQGGADVPRDPAATDTTQADTAMTPPPTSPSPGSPWDNEPPGAHQQERPIPRPASPDTASLSETNSAALLTGEDPAGVGAPHAVPAGAPFQAEPGAAGYPHAAPVASEATAAPPTQPLASPYDTGELPASPPGAAAHYEVPTASYGAATATHGAPQGYAPEGGYRQPDGGYQPDAGYHQEGYGGSQASAEAVPPPRSRALAHVLSVVLTLLGAPLAMLCLAAVQSRLAAQHQELLVAGGRYTLGVLAAFIGALVLVVGLAILARWSSLGAFVTGILMFGFGLAVLVAPALQTMGWLLSVRDALNNVGDLLLGDAMLVSLGSGQFALLGLVLLLAGYVSHSARRAGRRQERSAAYHAA